MDPPTVGELEPLSIEEEVSIETYRRIFKNEELSGCWFKSLGHPIEPKTGYNQVVGGRDSR